MDEKRINGMTVEDALKQFEPMVHKVVNSAKHNTVCGYEDLCQEGRMAIVKAFDDYDSTKGCSFSSWVYQKISGAILDYQKANLSILSGGAYLQGVLRKLGPDATADDLRAVGCMESTVFAANYINENFSPADIEKVMEAVPESEGIQEDISIGFIDWRKALTAKEVEVLECYFGFNGEPMQQTEIAKRVGTSRQGVKYIIQKALVKIKHMPGIEDYAFDDGR